MKIFREYKSLLPYLSQYRNRYILGLICLVIVDAAQIIIPQFIRIAIDIISAGDFQWRQIIVLCLCMIGTAAFISVGRFFWRYFIHGSSRRIEAQLREKLFDHLQKMSWDFYQKNKIGDLMARSINDLHAVRMSIGMGLVAFFDFIFMSTAILIIIFIQDSSSAIYSVIPLPIITILILVFGSMVVKKFRAAHEAYSKISDNAQETFAGINVIKSFVKEWWFVKKFASSNDEYRKVNMELVRLFGFFFPFVGFLSGLTILIMLAIGGVRVINGDMTPGSLVAMFRYLNMLIWPLMGAGFMVNMIQRGAVALSRINEILNTEPSIKNEQIVDSSEQIAANSQSFCSEQLIIPVLELSNLEFCYEVDKPSLEGINLKIMRGQWLGIMGRTGSGKSTLVKTFMRMVDPPAETVFVFGHDVRSWKLENLRSLFAVSPQDSYLFSDSIANNIRFGKNETDCESDMEKTITLASLNKDLGIFQDGKNTLVGERGLTLSGGQKQRTAIARAVIMDSEFLILDDSFSAVDNETEFKILENLRKERKGRTTIIVSHRVSTLKYSDNILVLDKGKILEYGKPGELIKTEGYYSKMAAFQSMVSEKLYG
ncbi:MAG: ABC transporter ATP-binding protein/permease [Treponema sp.]|jgi:ATP-binding cassette subfamily B protein|nr:ABC transporter ATP-binding protein/permease [Treponema sp.]